MSSASPMSHYPILEDTFDSCEDELNEITENFNMVAKCNSDPDFSHHRLKCSINGNPVSDINNNLLSVSKYANRSPSSGSSPVPEKSSYNNGLRMTTRSFIEASNLNSSPSAFKIISNNSNGCLRDYSIHPPSMIYPGRLDMSSNTQHRMWNRDRQAEDYPVDLHLSNLDNTIGLSEMQRLISEIFMACRVNFLNVYAFLQSDGNTSALVKVASQEDARVAISQVHRKRIGSKKIVISYRHGGVHAQKPNLLRSQVMALLSDVPQTFRLPLYKFREMFEKRYNATIGLSDLYKMKDIAIVVEETEGRSIQRVTGPPNDDSFCSADDTLSSATNQLPSFDHSVSPIQVHKRSTLAVPGDLLLESLPCPKHCPLSLNDECWAERECSAQLPVVNISLVILSNNIKQLILDHNGSVPLSSLLHCYEAQFEAFKVVPNEDGVPLEHLISCINKVTIKVGISEKKHVVFMHGNDSHSISDGRSQSPYGYNRGGNRGRSLSPYGRQHNYSRVVLPPGDGSIIPSPFTCNPLASALSSFAREATEVLKMAPGCRINFQKFIPIYHHHFGRQCRVAEYGYTKLRELLDAISHVVQVMGEGNRLQLTLTHKAQIKRFTSELLKVLKSQPGKQADIKELDQLFEKITGKPFKIIDYGVCTLEDMVYCLPNSTVLLSINNMGNAGSIVLSLPQREQTLEEVEKLAVFSKECFEILKHDEDCSILFNKFIPAYHHHFGRQCRVGDYGFLKLIELFEAIPDMVDISENSEEERVVQLTDSQRLIVLADRVVDIIEMYQIPAIQEASTVSSALFPPIKSSGFVRLSQIKTLYLTKFGSHLRPENYGASTLHELIGKLNQKIVLELIKKKEDGKPEFMVGIVDRDYVYISSRIIRSWLATCQNGEMTWNTFSYYYTSFFKCEPDAARLRIYMNKWIIFPYDEQLKRLQHDSVEKNGPRKTSGDGPYVRLTPLYFCAAQMAKLLEVNGGSLPILNFESNFTEMYGTPLNPGRFGFNNLQALINGLDDVFEIKGRNLQKYVCLVKLNTGRQENSGSLSTKNVRQHVHDTEFFTSTPIKTNFQRSAFLKFNNGSNINNNHMLLPQSYFNSGGPETYNPRFQNAFNGNHVPVQNSSFPMNRPSRFCSSFNIRNEAYNMMGISKPLSPCTAIVYPASRDNKQFSNSPVTSATASTVTSSTTTTASPGNNWSNVITPNIPFVTPVGNSAKLAMEYMRQWLKTCTATSQQGVSTELKINIERPSTPILGAPIAPPPIEDKHEECSGAAESTAIQTEACDSGFISSSYIEDISKFSK